MERSKKTQMCFHWKNGHCERTKAECLFAHGKNDLAPCSYWERGGYCSKGESCERPHFKICSKYELTGICENASCNDNHPTICKGWGTIKGCKNLNENKKCYYFHPKAESRIIASNASLILETLPEIQMDTFWESLEFPILIINPLTQSTQWVKINQDTLNKLKPCLPVYIDFDLPPLNWNGTKELESWIHWKDSIYSHFGSCVSLSNIEGEFRPIFGTH